VNNITNLTEIKNNESRWYIDIESISRGHNTTVHVYQGVTLREIDDTVEKAKLKKLKRKILVMSGYGVLLHLQYDL
jgi:hypothetical protein